MKVVKFQRHQTPVDVAIAAKNAIDSGYPMVMLARRPSGEWEMSMFLPPNVNEYEAVGALWQAQHRLIYEDD